METWTALSKGVRVSLACDYYTTPQPKMQRTEERGLKMAKGTKVTGELCFEPPIADELERKRDRARPQRRIVYDCAQAKVVGSRVFCRQGSKLGIGMDGGLPLVTVLRAVGPSVCQECLKYEDYWEGG